MVVIEGTGEEGSEIKALAFRRGGKESFLTQRWTG